MAVTSLTGLIIKNPYGRNTAVKGWIDPRLTRLLSPDGVFNYDPSDFLVRLDALVMEGFDKTYVPTRSQVEKGATISDHVTPNPDKLTIEAIVSNSPVGLIGTVPGPGAFAQVAFENLEKLCDRREPFTFVGGFKVYKSMVMTKFNPTRDFKKGGVLHFTATMEQILTAAFSQHLVAVKDVGPGGPKTTPDDQGTQPVSEPDLIVGPDDGRRAILALTPPASPEPSITPTPAP